MHHRSLPVVSERRGRGLRFGVALALALAICGVWGRAWADHSSGPERITYAQKAWGTLYHAAGLVPQAGEADFSGQVSIRTPEGYVTVHAEGDGFEVSYPDRTSLVIEPAGDEVRILFKGRPYFLRRHLSGFEASLPDDKISCLRRGERVTIAGRAGTVSVTEGAAGFEIRSPAGETRYDRAGPGEPFRLTGVAMSAHPYLRRGVHFERYGVGAFIDFKLRELGRAFSVLGWEPLLLER